MNGSERNVPEENRMERNRSQRKADEIKKEIAYRLKGRLHNMMNRGGCR